MTMISSLFANVAPFFILLGILIFVHELGHFLVAKYFGVRVETFSLGFGKKLIAVKRGETTYCLSAIPLGGYVKMFGDDPTQTVAEDERNRAFLHKPVSQRIAVVLAGPLMNLLFAFILFVMIGAVGEESAGPFLGDVTEDSKAYAAGFRSGDKIVKVGSDQVVNWGQVRKRVEAAPGKVLSFVVERAGEPGPLTFDVSVGVGENENIFSSDRQVGQIPGFTNESRSSLVAVKPESAAAKAGVQTMDLITAVNGKKVSYWRELRPTIFAALEEQAELKLTVRDINKDEKPENLREVTIIVPTGWDEKTDLMNWVGFESPELYVYGIKKGSPAEKAGIQAKDKVVRINNEDLIVWNDVLTRVKAFDEKSEGMDFTILRDGKEQTLKIRPEMSSLMTPKGQEEKRYIIGIMSGLLPIGPELVFHRLTNPLDLFKQGVRETVNWTEFVVMSIVRLVQGDVSAKNIGGVITIGRVASHSFAAGLATFLKTMAIISINLFLVNLLPIPILDGGHLVFYSIEGLRGAPISMRKMELAQQIGLMILMFMMVFAVFNDITNLIFNRW